MRSWFSRMRSPPEPIQSRETRMEELENRLEVARKRIPEPEPELAPEPELQPRNPNIKPSYRGMWFVPNHHENFNFHKYRSVPNISLLNLPYEVLTSDSVRPHLSKLGLQNLRRVNREHRDTANLLLRERESESNTSPVVDTPPVTHI